MKLDDASLSLGSAMPEKEAPLNAMRRVINAINAGAQHYSGPSEPET